MAQEQPPVMQTPQRMARRPNMRLVSRRLALAALVWLGCIAAGGLWVLQYRLDTYRADVQATARLRVNGLQDNIESHFRSLAALAQVLSRQPGFAEVLRAGVVPDPAGVDPRNSPYDEITYAVLRFRVAGTKLGML